MVVRLIYDTIMVVASKLGNYASHFKYNAFINYYELP